jgi:hypothetical protein
MAIRGDTYGVARALNGLVLWWPHDHWSLGVDNCEPSRLDMVVAAVIEAGPGDLSRLVAGGWALEGCGSPGDWELVSGVGLCATSCTDEVLKGASVAHTIAFLNHIRWNNQIAHLAADHTWRADVGGAARVKVRV